MVECTLSITHCLRLNLQLHTIDLVRTCRISSICTVAWQLARFQLTRRIARSLGDSWASCYLFYVSYYVLIIILHSHCITVISSPYRTIVLQYLVPLCNMYNVYCTWFYRRVSGLRPLPMMFKWDKFSWPQIVGWLLLIHSLIISVCFWDKLPQQVFQLQFRFSINLLYW